ncbi:N-acetyltransferase [Leptolyngbyaceae cyanobacterium CCMR0082]|uniref:N-acetyltransferase n=2 Tax=Adonisia turfae TaxID=2950184 RepID=A0A6M0SCJ3_9CYAN|nr:GNAT family N-acetyltransferase [Adonisia turfae]NEZ56954.1 N-acetyltransferase [Adonisia turfae CCMR0081]NEZ65392.1 N-acetyltransferase [Adonisia turfae CCMR0082]
MVYVSADPLLKGEAIARYELTLRPIADADQPFLRQVYNSTREEELAVVPWQEEQKQAFLEFQFNAQHTFYQNNFKQAHYWVIEQSSAPIGRLYLDRRADEICIIDIALLPAYRDCGIGTALLNTILAEAQARNQPVRIHVEPNNRALNLYHRLGFRQIGDAGVYNLMEWTP